MNDEQRRTLADLQRRLVVRIQALHKDAQEQPLLAERAGELAADLKAAAKRKRLELEEVRAKAEMEIRSAPSHFGLEKVTEAGIHAATVLHPEVQRVSRESVDADEDADKAASTANAYEHRRSMIANEVKLHGQNYFR